MEIWILQSPVIQVSSVRVTSLYKQYVQMDIISPTHSNLSVSNAQLDSIAQIKMPSMTLLLLLAMRLKYQQFPVKQVITVQKGRTL